MKYIVFNLSLFCLISVFSQDDPKFTIKGAKTADDLGYVSKRKALDCNKDLEWYPGSSVVYHKKSGKPYTGTCVAYYDNRKLERKTNFHCRPLPKKDLRHFVYFFKANPKI